MNKLAKFIDTLFSSNIHESLGANEGNSSEVIWKARGRNERSYRELLVDHQNCESEIQPTSTAMAHLLFWTGKGGRWLRI